MGQTNSARVEQEDMSALTWQRWWENERLVLGVGGCFQSWLRTSQCLRAFSSEVAPV